MFKHVKAIDEDMLLHESMILILQFIFKNILKKAVHSEHVHSDNRINLYKRLKCWI